MQVCCHPAAEVRMRSRRPPNTRLQLDFGGNQNLALCGSAKAMRTTNKMLARLVIILATISTMTGTASAHHKPGHQIPPGQMRKLYDPKSVVPAEAESVCLVTTEIAGDPYSDIIYSEWLPRAEAEAKANLGYSFIIYHPRLNSAQGCAGF